MCIECKKRSEKINKNSANYGDQDQSLGGNTSGNMSLMNTSIAGASTQNCPQQKDAILPINLYS